MDQSGATIANPKEEIVKRSLTTHLLLAPTNEVPCAATTRRLVVVFVFVAVGWTNGSVCPPIIYVTPFVSLPVDT
jgi:hypothetical protein